MKKTFITSIILTLLLQSESFSEFREINFGRYYQNANSNEISPLEWLVIHEDDDSMLLIRKKCVDEIPYNERRTNVAWETCTLKKWLNNENGLCAWWTRSPGKNNSQAVYLSSYGSFGNRPHYVDDDVIGVRPSVWVKKNFLAERILYSAKPDSQKAFEAENLFDVMYYVSFRTAELTIQSKQEMLFLFVGITLLHARTTE